MDRWIRLNVNPHYWSAFFIFAGSGNTQTGKNALRFFSPNWGDLYKSGEYKKIIQHLIFLWFWIVVNIQYYFQLDPDPYGCKGCRSPAPRTKCILSNFLPECPQNNKMEKVLGSVSDPHLEVWIQILDQAKILSTVCPRSFIWEVI